MADWQDIPGQWQDVPGQTPVDSGVVDTTPSSLTMPPIDAGVAAQVPAGINESLYKGVTLPFDLWTKLTNWAGLTNNAPMPSEALRGAAVRPGVDTGPFGLQRSPPPSTPGQRIGYDVGSAIGDVAPFALGGPVGGALRAAGRPVLGGIAETLGQSPAIQAGLTAAGNVVGSETDNSYLAAATPFALAPFVHGGQRTVSAAPATSTQEAERRALLEVGGPQTAGKITGSKKLQRYESFVNEVPIPFLGGRVGATETANRNNWQSRILESAGTTGETAATPEVRETMRQRIGNRINNAAQNATLTVEPRDAAGLTLIRAEHGDRLLTDTHPGLMRRIDELAQAPAAAAQGQNPQIAGTTYQNIRSDLSEIAGTSGDDNARRTAHALVNWLDGIAQRSLPPDVMQEFTDARRQWRNYATIDKAMRSANNESTGIGNIPVAAFNREASRGRGNPDLQRLAQYGTVYVGDKASNPSHSASHMQLGHLLFGGGLAEAFHQAPESTAIAAAVGAAPFGFDLAMNNPMTRALLLNRYRNPSQSFVTPGLFGSLAGAQAIQQSGGR